MDLSTLVTILTCLVGLAVSILLAGIPWAYTVHGRLVKIESNQDQEKSLLSQVITLERRVTRLEVGLPDERDR